MSIIAARECGHVRARSADRAWAQATGADVGRAGSARSCRHPAPADGEVSAMTGPARRDLGRVFNEVPGLYDRVRPACPGELFADLVAITGRDRRSLVLEVGCGAGQA